MAYDMSALGLDPSFLGSPALSNFLNMPSDQAAGMLAQNFAAGPGINWQGVDANKVLPLPDLQSIGQQPAEKKPGFDQILAGLAGVAGENKQPQLQAPQAAAPKSASMAPQGPGDQIIQSLMQNILNSAYQRNGFSAFTR